MLCHNLLKNILTDYKIKYCLQKYTKFKYTILNITAQISIKNNSRINLNLSNFH